MRSNSWNIRAANESDLDEILLLYKSCTVKMNESGLFNWHNTYPNRGTILNDIQSATLFLIETDHIHGAVALNDDQPYEYKDIHWEHHVEPYLVVHRLAIAPDQQGKGYGILLMEYAEELARDLSCPSIRMDVYTVNIPGEHCIGN